MATDGVGLCDGVENLFARPGEGTPANTRPPSASPASTGRASFGYRSAMSTASSDQPMTADDLLARSSELGRCELIEGELVMMTPAGGDHGAIVNELAWHLNRHVREHELGKIWAAETGFLLERKPDTVRAPDIAFIATHRVGEAQTPTFIPIPPDLAVEVNSPHDVVGEVAAKVEWWLAHGTALVWVVDLRSRTVTKYHPDGSARVVHINETLTGDDVLPGFELPLAKLFSA